MFQRGLKNQSIFIAIAVPICLILALFFALQIMKLKKGENFIFLTSIGESQIWGGRNVSDKKDLYT